MSEAELQPKSNLVLYSFKKSTDQIGKCNAVWTCAYVLSADWESGPLQSPFSKSLCTRHC